MAEKEAKELEEAKTGKNVEKQTEAVSQIRRAMEAADAIAEKVNVAESEEEIVIPKLYVVRRSYKRQADGNQYWEYILPAVFRGKISEVHFKASDVGGYEALDELFRDGVKKLELRAHEEKSYQEQIGVRKFWSYDVVYVDGDGFEWIYPVKTVRGSDKAVMENYIRYLRFDAEKSARA